VPVGFEVVEEGDDHGGVEILDLQLRWRGAGLAVEEAEK